MQNMKADKISHANIIGIQKENLAIQNKYLVDEINKYKAVGKTLNQMEKSHECACSKELFKFYEFFKTFFNNFEFNLKTLSKSIPAIDQDIVVFFENHFSSFGKIIDFYQKSGSKNEISNNEFELCRLQLDKSIEKIALNIGNIRDGQISNMSIDFNALLTAKNDEISTLKKINEKLTFDKTNQNSIEKTILELNAKLFDLQWKNHILEKRLFFGQNALLNQTQNSMKTFAECQDFYCYCGGRIIQELVQEFDESHFSKIKNNFASCLSSLSDFLNGELIPQFDKPSPLKQSKSKTDFEKESTSENVEKEIQILNKIINQSNSSVKDDEKMEIEKDEQKETNLDFFYKEKMYKNQILELQKSNQLLIELSENKRTDRMGGLKNFLDTNLFKLISDENLKNLDTIITLERKIEDLCSIISDMEEIRRREISDWREKLLIEREQFFNENAVLKEKVVDLENKNRLLLIQKDSKSTVNLISSNEEAKAQQEIVVLLQKTYQAIKNIIFKQRETLISRDSMIKEQETQIENLKNVTSGDRSVVIQEFRHQTHAEVFKTLRQTVDHNMIESIDELEKYIKSREDKIKNMSKEIKQINKELVAEKNNSSALFNEIAESCAAYEKLKSVLEIVKSELANSVESFNLIYKEKQIDKSNFDKKIADLENMVNLFQEKNKIKATMIENLMKDLRELDSSCKNQGAAKKEFQLLLETMISEKKELTEKMMMAEGEKELIEKRLIATEMSQNRVVQELSESISETAKAKSLQGQLLEILENKKVLPKFEDFGMKEEIGSNDDQRSHYFLKLLEADDLKVN